MAPSKTPAQARLMAAVAHGWKPPKSSGIKIPRKVAREFNEADTGTGIIRPKGSAGKKPPGRGLLGR